MDLIPENMQRLSNLVNNEVSLKDSIAYMNPDLTLI